jgi:hypothetical protein
MFEMCRLLAACFFVILPWLQPVHANEKLVSFWDCVDRATPSKNLWGTSLKLAHHEELAPNYFVAHGRLGWHVTWTVLLDLSQTPIAVYETFEPDGFHPFGRIETPWLLQRGFTRCGADWSGLWTDPWPDQTPAPSPSPPPLDGLPPITEVPIKDLLPPRSDK